MLHVTTLQGLGCQRAHEVYLINKRIPSLFANSRATDDGRRVEKIKKTPRSHRV
jgi:hypothetical protein